MNIQDIIFSPAECGALAIKALEEMRDTGRAGIVTGIKDLDDAILPFRPGELITVLGFTGWYKSGFMNFLLKSAIKQLQENDIVVKVTWEDSVEEDTIKWISSNTTIPVGVLIKGEGDNWNQVMDGYDHRIQVPIWMIGHSNSQATLSGTARPRLTMGNALEAINFVRTGFTDDILKPRMVVLDYLQRIRPDPKDGDSKREQMMEAVNLAKDMAIQLGCPVILGVQAGRKLTDRGNKLPRIDDGQETSNIEQTSDKMLSLWYPIKTEAPDDMISINGHDILVTKNVLICGVMKQKMGPAPTIVPLYVDPSVNHITGLAL